MTAAGKSGKSVKAGNKHELYFFNGPTLRNFTPREAIRRVVPASVRMPIRPCRQPALLNLRHAGGADFMKRPYGTTRHSRPR
ncbi:hypothetical protein bAD24_III01845 [Burkholderia sp. AD24]|nr:hypothetical protein bAD24_III01845 [Burkholderia sp. AD24]